MFVWYTTKKVQQINSKKTTLLRTNKPITQHYSVPGYIYILNTCTTAKTIHSFNGAQKISECQYLMQDETLTICPSGLPPPRPKFMQGVSDMDILNSSLPSIGDSKIFKSNTQSRTVVHNVS